jgi:hypothetical protein
MTDEELTEYLGRTILRLGDGVHKHFGKKSKIYLGYQENNFPYPFNPLAHLDDSFRLLDGFKGRDPNICIEHDPEDDGSDEWYIQVTDKNGSVHNHTRPTLQRAICDVVVSATKREKE